MATNEVDINIRVNDKASAKIKGVNKELNNTGKAGNTASAGISKMLIPIGAAIVSFQTLKRAISGIGDAIKLFANFDDTMRKVQAVTKASDSQMKTMTDTAKKLGETTRYSASQAAEALTFLGMAGFTAEEATAALSDVLNLAAAGGLDLGQAADIATNILSGFGLEVEQLSRVNDVLAEAFTGSNTTLTELGEGFKYVGPIAKGVGANFEDLIASMGKLGDAGIKGCYDNKTDVLTLDGWKHWSDVSLEDSFATYCEDKNVIEYQKASRLIRYHHNGKMYKVQNRGVNLCVTPDHRMFVKPRGKKDFEILRADEIVGKSVRYLTGGMEWEGKTPLLYRVNGFLQDRGNWDKTITAKYIHPDIWAAFMGWYISEGSINECQGDYKITIAQIKPDHLDEIKTILDQLPWNFSYFKSVGFQCCSQQLFKELEPLGKQLDRYIPQYLKNWGTPQLEKLYDALIKGDGDQNSTYYTSSLKLKDDIQEIALKLGYATFSKIRHEKNSQIWFNPEDRYIRANADGWKINVASRRINPWWENSNYTGVHGDRLDYSRHDIFEGWIDYDGEVFCAEVPNHLLIVRREGRAIVSGNSLAGTTLRGVIDALFNPTREEAQLMKELSDRIGGVGLQIRDSNGNFIGFRKLVEQLEKAGLKGEEALKLFGARAGPGMAALLNIGSASIEEFTKDLETVDNTTGKIKDTMEGGLGGALRGLKSAAEGTGLQLGESFGTGLVESINTLTFTFRRLTKEIKNLDESGIITKITDSINALVKTFSLGLDLGIAQIKSFGTTFGVAWDVINGRFDEAKKRITDFQKSYREIFQSRDLLASDELIKLDLVDKKIAGYQKQIQLIEGAAKNSTRGMSKAQQSLIDNAKAQIASLTVERQKLAEAYQDTLTFDIAGEIAKAQQAGGPIGTGTDKVDPNKKIADMAKAAAEARAKAERESNLTSAKLTADLQVQRAELESLYQTDSISLMEYYEGRRKIIESAANEELRILEEKSLKTQENTDDAAKIDAKIYASKQKLNAELIRLDTEYYDAVVKNEENILKTQLENAKARELAQQAITDIQSRVDAGGERNLEVEFMQELADLQERQNKELEIISKSKDKEIQLEQYKALQKKEIDQLSFDQHKRLMEARLTLAKEITSGTVQAFTDLYYLTGEKQKEFFYIAKAAALAETTINTAQGISKAWAQGGIYGAIGAALVAVQGAIQVAKITSTGLAEGGIVPGYSPSSKSDNIPARLTAGEYVQPVDVVKHYGLGAMEALRNKVIPRDVFSNMSARLSSIPRLNYAEGGPVVAPISDSNNASGTRDNITIINYTDRQELLSALGTKDGINAVINVISGNREKVSRVLR